MPISHTKSRLAGLVKQYAHPLRAIFDDFRQKQDVISARLEGIIFEVNDSMVEAFAAESSIHTSKKNMLDPLEDVSSLALPTLAPVKRHSPPVVVKWLPTISPPSFVPLR